MQVYTLNIGGLFSEITEKCLKNKGPHSLSELVKFPDVPLPQGIYEDDRGGFFIDGDSESMDVVLNYLRGYPLPCKSEETLLRKVYFDAKRFHITELMWDIEDLIDIDTPDSLVDEIHDLNPHSKANTGMNFEYLVEKRDQLKTKKRNEELRERTRELQSCTTKFFEILSDLMWPYVSIDKAKLNAVLDDREDEIKDAIAQYCKESSSNGFTHLLELFYIIACTCRVPKRDIKSECKDVGARFQALDFDDEEELEYHKRLQQLEDSDKESDRPIIDVVD